MKRFLSVLLSVLIVFTCLSSTICVTAADYDFVTVQKDFGEVGFSCGYAEIGKEMAVTVNGRDGEKLLYKWYIDGSLINNISDRYTPVESDMGSMIEVEVFDCDGNPVGRKSMYVSLLPVVYIETADRQDIVVKKQYIDAEIHIQGNAEFNDSDFLYDGATQIRGRGNSTWRADKKPYRLKLDSKADLFGMGKNKHWALLSNPYDSSLMRNAVSYGLAEDMGLDFQDNIWVDVVLNGKVVGNYQLCEHIRVDETRVDIPNWEDVAEDAAKAIYKKHQDTLTKDDRDAMIDIMVEDMSWTTSDRVTYNDVTYSVSEYFDYPDINGGYLTEIVSQFDEYTFATDRNLCVAVDTPETLSDDMLSYLSSYYQAFEDALFSDDFCTEYDGKTMRYTDFIDVESFVKGFLVNEIFENFDFGRTSTWIYKDVDGKLVYGPVWDMDYNASNYCQWTAAGVTWLKRFLCDPVFMKELRETYFEYRYTDIQDMLRDGGDIDQAVEKITASAMHNDSLWKNEPTFFENVENMKYHLQQKIFWLDKVLGDPEAARTSVSGAKYDSAEVSFDEITSIAITKKPAKTLYDAGEAIDLTGLELTVTYADGTQQVVDPDLVYTYARDSVGRKFYSYDKVTDDIGDTTYLGLCYRNKKTLMKIKVNPRTNYVEVDELIGNLPDKIDGNRFVVEMFEAQIAYNALSDDAKAKVENIDKLNALMTAFEESANNTEKSVLACIVDGLFKTNARSTIITVSKGSPRKIIYETPADGATATYGNETAAYVSQKIVGNFALTTINHLIAENETYTYDIKASYVPAVESEKFSISVADLRYEAKNINSLFYNKQLNCGEELVVKFNKDKEIRSVRLLENGKNLNAKLKLSADGSSLVKNFDKPGKHTITVEYLYSSSWIEYGSFDIYVREKLSEENMIFNFTCPAEAYSKTIEIKATTTKGYEDLSLVCGESAIPMTFTDNGDYKLWTATVDITDGNIYTLYADGNKTQFKVDCKFLESLSVDGTKLIKVLADTPTVEIPEYITEIADDAFDGYEGKIICYPESAAEKFAEENGLDYEAFRFEVSITEANLLPGEAVQVEVTASPYMPEDFVLNSSVDESVAVYNDGTLTAVAPGYTRLELSSKGGLFNETVYVRVGGGLTPADINGDDKINSLDALMILQHVVEKIKLTEAESVVADVDGNGKINSADALAILQIVTEKKSVWDFIK